MYAFGPREVIRKLVAEFVMPAGARRVPISKCAAQYGLRRCIEAVLAVEVLIEAPLIAKLIDLVVSDHRVPGDDGETILQVCGGGAVLQALRARLVVVTDVGYRR